MIRRALLFLAATALVFYACSLLEYGVNADRLTKLTAQRLVSKHLAELKGALSERKLIAVVDGKVQKLAVTRISVQVPDPSLRKPLREGLGAFLEVNPQAPRALREFHLRVVLQENTLVAKTRIYPRFKAAKLSYVETRVSLPNWGALLPPLFAILIAVFFRQVLIALFAAIWLGANLHISSNPIVSLWHTATRYLWGTFVDTFSLQIIFFTVSLIGVVHVLTLAGGIQGMVDVIARRARGVRSTLVSVWLMGLALFFDDYANSIVVGGAARPLTDNQRISREKLAYIVDSTAAPVAGVAIISTWIGYEVGLLESPELKLAYAAVAQSGYEMFFQMLPYRFYCFIALFFVLANAVLRRDFGPMYRAERRARSTGKVVRDGAELLAEHDAAESGPRDGAPSRWYNGLLPIAGIVLYILCHTFLLGRSLDHAIAPSPWRLDVWRQCFVAVGNAERTTEILAYSGLFGTLLAIAMVVGQGILTVKEAVMAWLRGVRAMWLAVAILVLAMAIRTVTKDLATADYLVSLLGGLNATWLPLTIFLVSAAVAFSTGTSWGAMAILLPVALPLMAELHGGGLLMVLAGSAVLDGAIFGDHCSPISDTTVLSSVASGCDHLDHVYTQVPYALVSMGIAAFAGYLFVANGGALIVGYAMAIAATVAVLLIVGRNPDHGIAAPGDN